MKFNMKCEIAGGNTNEKKKRLKFKTFVQYLDNFPMSFTAITCRPGAHLEVGFSGF